MAPKELLPRAEEDRITPPHGLLTKFSTMIGQAGGVSHGYAGHGYLVHEKEQT